MYYLYISSKLFSSFLFYSLLNLSALIGISYCIYNRLIFFVYKLFVCYIIKFDCCMLIFEHIGGLYLQMMYKLCMFCVFTDLVFYIYRWCTSSLYSLFSGDVQVVWCSLFTVDIYVVVLYLQVIYKWLVFCIYRWCYWCTSVLVFYIYMWCINCCVFSIYRWCSSVLVFHILHAIYKWLFCIYMQCISDCSVFAGDVRDCHLSLSTSGCVADQRSHTAWGLGGNQVLHPARLEETGWPTGRSRGTWEIIQSKAPLLFREHYHRNHSDPFF